MSAMCGGISRIIVFAVNDSTGCNTAWAWAKSNIFLHTDTIILVNVWTNNILLGSRYNKATATASRGILRKYQARCERHGIKCHSIGIEGSVSQSIANAALTNSCDFIILGSSCTTGYIKRTWTGSLSEKVASLASCPVLSVRKNHKEAGFDLAVLPRRICLSVRPPPPRPAGLSGSLTGRSGLCRAGRGLLQNRASGRAEMSFAPVSEALLPCQTQTRTQIVRI